MPRARPESVTDDTAPDPAGDEPAHTDTPSAVVAQDLTFAYPDGTRAVDGLSLSIPRGECFGFLGPNGAGKTTTIKLLATLLSPTDGTVRVNGYDATSRRDAIRGTIGYMAQSVSVDRDLTARDNLAFACKAYGVPRDRRRERIDELLDLVDLADVADTPAGQFSGGMQKRLDAATALVHDPPLVFLDEPTTGLDPKARSRLWEYFERINERGTTVFLTTQYLAEADALCDRLALLRDGSLVESGTPESLKRRVGGAVLAVEIDGGTDTASAATTVARERVLLDPEATVETDEGMLRVTTERARQLGPDLLVALRDAGFDVTGFDIAEPTLDDVFFALADESTDDLDATGDHADAAQSTGEGR